MSDTRRPSILYLVHGFPPEEETGTPLVAAGYAEAMASRGWDVTVVHGSADVRRWKDVSPTTWPGERITRVAMPTNHIVGSLWAVTAPSTVRDGAAPSSVAFERVLNEIAPDIVHVIDNVNLPIDWPERAAARGIPVVRTVSCAEDLCSLIAPVSSLSDREGYCQAPITPERCAACFASSDFIGDPRNYMPPRAMEEVVGISESASAVVREREALVELFRTKRARAVSQYMETFASVVFSSRGFRSYFERTLPLDTKKVRVIPQGIDAGDLKVHTDHHLNSEGPVTIAYAGTLSTVKGLDALVTAFLHPDLLKRDDYRLEIFGGGEERFIQELLETNPFVRWHGPYQSDQLPALLSEVDIGLSTSRFETFHRVTREYLLSGIPVIGSTAFGIPEVVRHGVNGLLFDHADEGSLLRAILACLNDRELLGRLTEGARHTGIRSVTDEINDLEALYETCLPSGYLAASTS